MVREHRTRGRVAAKSSRASKKQAANRGILSLFLLFIGSIYILYIMDFKHMYPEYVKARTVKLVISNA
jgi:hypothetical protein